MTRWVGLTYSGKTQREVTVVSVDGQQFYRIKSLYTTDNGTGRSRSWEADVQTINGVAKYVDLTTLEEQS